MTLFLPTIGVPLWFYFSLSFLDVQIGSMARLYRTVVFDCLPTTVSPSVCVTGRLQLSVDVSLTVYHWNGTDSEVGNSKKSRCRIARESESPLPDQE